MMTWPPLITPAAYGWAAEARQEPQPSLAGCPVSDPQTGQRLVCGHRWSPACPLCAEASIPWWGVDYSHGKQALFPVQERRLKELVDVSDVGSDLLKGFE